MIFEIGGKNEGTYFNGWKSVQRTFMMESEFGDKRRDMAREHCILD